MESRVSLCACFVFRNSCFGFAPKGRTTQRSPDSPCHRYRDDVGVFGRGIMTWPLPHPVDSDASRLGVREDHRDGSEWSPPRTLTSQRSSTLEHDAGVLERRFSLRFPLRSLTDPGTAILERPVPHVVAAVGQQVAVGASFSPHGFRTGRAAGRIGRDLNHGNHVTAWRWSAEPMAQGQGYSFSHWSLVIPACFSTRRSS